MNSRSYLDLDKQLCFALYACSREITKLYRPLLDPLGLTYTQYVTMLALWGAGRMKVKDLGNELHLDSGTLTPLLKKLETAGVVKRIRDKLDERNVWIEVTDTGWKLREQASHVPMQAFCTTGLTLADGEALHGRLISMLRKLQSPSQHSSQAQPETANATETK